jgi:mRNA interferase RelE/StbE
MKYSLLILRRAQKELASLDKNEYTRVRDAISSLAENPRPAGCKKLVGREGWRIRVGNYRVIFEINDAKREVIVFHIGHRRDIYS